MAQINKSAAQGTRIRTDSVVLPSEQFPHNQVSRGETLMVASNHCSVYNQHPACLHHTGVSVKYDSVTFIYQHLGLNQS
jgi:hypothetical protein